MNYLLLNSLILENVQNDFLNNLTCSSSECQCWIIILLNILAVLYLVFCSFYKVTKLTKIFGWVYGCILITGTVGIVAMHTCIFTILCTVFTVMIYMAILSVILPNQTENKIIEKEIGSYVIRKENNGFVFSIYDNKKIFLVKSFKIFNSVSETKSAIEYCRENGSFAEVENQLQEWVQKREHPKFIIYKENKMFYFRLLADQSNIILESDGFQTEKQCIIHLNKIMVAIKSTDVYILSNIVNKIDEPIDEIHKNDDLRKETITNNNDERLFIQKKSFMEKFEELSNIQKNHYNKLDKYLLSKDNVKKIIGKENVIYKYGSERIIKLRIHEGFIEAMINLMDNEYKNKEINVRLKEALTVIRIINKDYYSYLISVIDKKYNYLFENKKLKQIKDLNTQK